MRGLKSILRDRRAKNRHDQYEADGAAGYIEHTSDVDYDTLVTKLKILNSHKPLLRFYEHSMRKKLARPNSYLVAMIDHDGYVAIVWWVQWEKQRRIGLTRYEFSDEAVMNPQYEDKGYHFDD